LDNDLDDNNATIAAPGVYLVAMRLQMEELNRSDPFYIVWGTPAVTTASLSAAAAWVGDYADQLAPNFAADFDGDLDVDGADFLTWQQGLGTSGGALQRQGDADGDRGVNAVDLAIWQTEFGASLETFAGVPSTAAVLPTPEPSGLLLLALASLQAVHALRQRRRSHIGPLEAMSPL
jgi:hypothetical protein